jgi:hypothetical protein
VHSIRATLKTDGPSDQVLVPILNWVLSECAAGMAANCQWADLRRTRKPAEDLVQRIKLAVDLFACDLLFVHRDAESQSPGLRYKEINMAVEEARSCAGRVRHVCIVPVRMQEAWLLLCEKAIRRAAGNPNGKAPLELPHPSTIEEVPDPKRVLYDCLTRASELKGRRRKKFHPPKRARLVTQPMTEFPQLRMLRAFRRLEDDVRKALPSVWPSSMKEL